MSIHVFGRSFLLLYQNLVFPGAFGLEVIIVSFGIIACCSDCSGTYSGSTIGDSGIAHCIVTLLSILSLTDVCDETEVSNGGGLSTFLSKTDGVGKLGGLLTTGVSVSTVLSVIG